MAKRVLVRVLHSTVVPMIVPDCWETPDIYMAAVVHVGDPTGEATDYTVTDIGLNDSLVDH